MFLHYYSFHCIFNCSHIFSCFLISDVLNVVSFTSFFLMYLTSKQYFQVLYHVLSVVPAYQASVGPALNELCLGLQADDVANVILFLC